MSDERGEMAMEFRGALGQLERELYEKIVWFQL